MTLSFIIFLSLWKQPRCPSADEWIIKLWYIYTMEYYSAIKKNSFGPARPPPARAPRSLLARSLPRCVWQAAATAGLLPWGAVESGASSLRRAPPAARGGGREGGRGQGERATEPGLGGGGAGREGGGARGGGSPPSPAAAAAAAGRRRTRRRRGRGDLGPLRVSPGAGPRPRPGAPSAPGALAGGAPAVRPRPAGQCEQGGGRPGPASGVSLCGWS